MAKAVLGFGSSHAPQLRLSHEHWPEMIQKDTNDPRFNYQEVLAMGPDSSTRSIIEERIKRLELHRELAQMREEYEQESQGRNDQLEGLRNQADQNRRGHDPLWGRFQTRGWLE